jgi:hypothetical protein
MLVAIYLIGQWRQRDGGVGWSKVSLTEESNGQHA